MTTPDASKRPALPLSTPPDPEIVKRHLTEIRHAEHAVVQAKHWLASYLSTHARAACEYGAPIACAREVDGFILGSCGHSTFLCAQHGSQVLSDTLGKHPVCYRTESGYHDKPADSLLRWESLA